MNGLLSGGLARVFASAFGQMYLEGWLHQPKLRQDASGDGAQNPVYFVDYPVRYQVDNLSDALRTDVGIPQRDVRVLVLQKSLPDTAYGVAPSQDDEITTCDGRFRITSVNQDPARAAWAIQATPV